jgi:preprotein translocase subunit SecF
MSFRSAVSTFRGHRVPHFSIIGNRNRWFIVSGALIALSLFGLFVVGLKFSIDFTGGALLTFDNRSGASITDYQDILGSFDLKGSTVELINGNQVQIRTESLTSAGAGATPSPSASASASPSASASASATGAASASPSASASSGASPTASAPVISTPSPSPHLVGDEVRSALARVAGISVDQINENDVGPTWGSQISAKAFQGLVIFILLVAAYISLRFEPKMAASALIALGHDLIITAGVYALVGREVTPAAVIGILTILGYSLYDTVVIFDKIKENTDNQVLVARDTYAGVVNLSLNQTLMRSVNTSLVVLLPIGSLLLFGGPTLKDFAFALFVGVAIGAYSSIFVASPVLVVFKEREPRYKALQARQSQRAARATATAQRPARSTRAVATTGPGPSGNGEAAGSTVTEGDGHVATPPRSQPASAQANRPAGSGRPGGGTKKKSSGARSKPKRRRR